MTVWLFVQAGQTESGLVDGAPAIQQAVRRSLTRAFGGRTPPEVRWLAPRVGLQKPGPKHGTPTMGRGTTGADLTRMLRRHLQRYRAGEAGDVVLLVDDADCRFCEGQCAPTGCRERFERWVADWSAEVAELRPGVQAVALFASPETEAWFALLPQRSLAGLGLPEPERTRLAAELRHEFAAVECSGRRKPEGGCEPKFRAVFTSRLDQRYRPAIEGPPMLAEIDLGELAEVATVFVRPAWQRLLRATNAPP